MSRRVSFQISIWPAIARLFRHGICILVGLVCFTAHADPDYYFSFNGTNYATTTVTATNVFAPTNGTFELWFRSTGTNNNRYIAGTYNYPGGYCFKVYRTNNTSICSFFFIQGNNVAKEVMQTNNFNIRDGEWHHLAATWTNNTLALWIGGAFENSTTLTTTQKIGGSLLLGAVPKTISQLGGAAPAEACDIALARLSSSVRYATAFTAPTWLSNDSKTVALWTMDEVIGTIAYDFSDNGADLELVPDSRWNYPVWETSGISDTMVFTSVPMATDITYQSASILWAVTNATGQTAAHTLHYRLNGSTNTEAVVAQEGDNGSVSVALTNLLAGRTYDYYAQSSNDFADVRLPTGILRYNRFSTELLNGMSSYLDFNGSNYATTSLTTTNVFAPTNGTFELWFRSTDTNNNRYIAGTFNNTGGYCFKAYRTNNTSICSVYFVQGDNAVKEVRQTSNINIRDGDWHHLAATWTNNTLALWIGGAFENSATLTTTQRIGGSLLLGAVPKTITQLGGAAPAEACDIAMARLSSKVRYATAFAAPTSLSKDGNTVALWTLDQVIGTIVYDCSDNGADLALVPDSHWNYPVWETSGISDTMVFTSVPMVTDITCQSASILWAVTNATGQTAAHTLHYRLSGSTNTEVEVAQEGDNGSVSVALTNLLAGRTYDYYAQSSNDFANVRLPTGILRYNRFSTELLNGMSSYLNFNGSNYASTTVLTTNVFAPTNGTFELWFRSTETNDNRYIAGTFNNTGGYCFKAYQTNNTSICSFYFVQGNNVVVEVRQTSNINIRDGDWHHLAATWNNNTLALWIGGAFENSATLTTTQRIGGSLLLGAVPKTITQLGGAAPAAKCDIALARLSSSVRYTTAFASPTSLSSDGNTIGLWTMEEGIGVIANDSSANDYDVTLVSDSKGSNPTWGSTGISPTITITGGPTIFDITNESASVVWTVTNSTAQAATHKIRYWSTGTPTNSATAGTDPGNGEVTITMTNLLAGHTYNYYVQSSNSFASTTVPTGSPGYTNFSTPSWIYVSSPSYSSLSTNSVDINWNVQNDSTTTVTHYVTVASYGYQTITNFSFDSNPGPVVTNVTLSVSNLTRGVTYNYTVASFISDANGYGSNHVAGYWATNGSTFTVPTQPFIGISNLHSTNVLPNSMDLVWTVTNRTSNSATHLVTYLVDVVNGTMSDPFLPATNVINGQVSVHVSGLQPATTYYCVAQSILDGMTNYYVPSLVMTSLSLSADTAGVRITNAPTLVSTNGYSFTLSWGFQNDGGTGVYHMVTYSPSGGYSSLARTVTAYTPAGANTVSVVLSGLDPSSSYTFNAGSIAQGSSGETAYYATTNGTFTTTNFTLPQYITLDSVTNSVVTDTMALVTWHVDKVDPDDVAFHYVISSTNGVPTNVVNAIVTEGFEDEDGNVMAFLTGLTPYTNCCYYVQSVINGASGFYRTDTRDGNFYSFMPGYAWFGSWDFLTVSGFISVLNNGTPVSVFLTNQFSESSRWVLSNTGTNTQEQGTVLADELNRIIGTGVSIYDSNRFAGVTLSKYTTNLLVQASKYGDFVQLNRVLLRDAYRDYISTNLTVDMLPADTSGDTPIIAVTGTPTTNGVTDSMAWITWNVTITDTNYVASHFVVYNVGSAPATTNALMATGVQGTNGMVMALLEGLPPGSEVYYYIHSIIDPGIGHYVTDNNYGASYSFTTRSSGDNSDYSTTGNDILNWWKSVYGFNPLNSKVAYTRWIGTGPLFWDSDGDGVPDWKDAFPNDPNLSQMPGSSSQEGPAITLIEPTDAQPIQ